MELRFVKVTKTSAFCSSVEKPVTRAWYVPKTKEVPFQQEFYADSIHFATLLNTIS